MDNSDPKPTPGQPVKHQGILHNVGKFFKVIAPGVLAVEADVALAPEHVEVSVNEENEGDK